MGKQIVVCNLPVPLLGARPQSPPFSSCPKARKMLHRASVPEAGTLAVSRAHRSPEGDPHVIRSCTIGKSSLNHPSTSLGPEDPHPVHLPGTAHVGPKAPLSASATGHRHNRSFPSRFLDSARSLLRGAVCSPSSKVGDLRPPTPVHLTGTSSDERNR
jgi:hypothetical protein